jgi:hypothetical protein
MKKTLNELCAVALLSGAAVVTLAQSAEARSRCDNEECKRPIIGTKVDTSYHYNTVRRAENVTKYKDVDRPHQVVNVHRVVNVTRIQPVDRVHDVTRVHNRTEVLNETQHAAETKNLPAQSETSAKTIQLGGDIPSPKETTSYRYNTVQKFHDVTHYNDVDRTQYMKHIHRIVDVTQVQPVIHTNVVTRIHDRPVVMSRVVQENRTETLPTRTIHSGKTIRTNYRSDEESSPKSEGTIIDNE